MTDLPDVNDIIGGSTTEAEFQQAMNDLYDYLNQLAAGGDPETNEIDAGVITPTKAFVIVDTENDSASDDLTNMSDENIGHKMAFIRCESDDRPVTIKHLSGGSDPFFMTTGADAVLDDTEKFMVFYYDNVNNRWKEIFRNWGMFLPTAGDVTAALAQLGLGSAALVNTGTGASAVPLNSDLGALAYLETINNVALIADSIITGAKIASNTIPLNRLSNQTAGSLIVANASGVVSNVVPGSSGTYLKSNGPGAAPSYATLDTPTQDVEYIGELDLGGLGADELEWTNGTYDVIFIEFERVRGGGIEVRVIRNGSIYSGNAYRVEKNLGESLVTTDGFSLGTPNTIVGFNGMLQVCGGVDGYYPSIQGILTDVTSETHLISGACQVSGTALSGLQLNRVGGNFSTGSKVRMWGLKR